MRRAQPMQRLEELEETVDNMADEIVRLRSLVETQQDALEELMEYLGIRPQRLELFDGYQTVNLHYVGSKRSIHSAQNVREAEPISASAQVPIAPQVSEEAAASAGILHYSAAPFADNPQDEQDGGEAASTSAETPGVILTPPTPQTSQEAATYVAVRLLELREEQEMEVDAPIGADHGIGESANRLPDDIQVEASNTDADADAGAGASAEVRKEPVEVPPADSDDIRHDPIQPPTSLVPPPFNCLAPLSTEPGVHA